ncbi:MAG: helix-turn-helix domain-containing protein [Thermomicrobiales bacterium]
MSCLSRSTVASHLEEMQVVGLISRGYDHVTILDPPALRQLAVRTADFPDRQENAR